MKYENYIEKYSAQYDVPKTLLLAVIKTESSFDPKAAVTAPVLAEIKNILLGGLSKPN